MVKVTLLSEKKTDRFHSIMAFYDFKGTAINECECGKFIYQKSYWYEDKRYKNHTTSFSNEEFENLKKALKEGGE